MKKTTIVLVFLIFGYLSNFVNATVRTVSNSPANPGQYASLTSAQNDAGNGDTLLIHGTGFNYGNFTITKPLVLIGAGFYQSTVVTGHESYIPNFYFSKSANGAKIIGLTFGNIYSGGNNTDTINNMLIEECYIGGIVNSNYPWTNVTFRNCIFERTQNLAVAFYFAYTYANITFDNCIFNGYVIGKGLIFNHCLFLYPLIYQQYTLDEVTNSVIENSMFIRAYDGVCFNTAGSVNNTFNNNLTFHATVSLPYATCIGDSNISANPLFVTQSATDSYFNISYDYHLQPGSPAKNAATDGTDIGVYGGINKFSTVLEPLMTPIIRQFTINNPSISPGGTLNIDVIVSKPLDH